MSCILIIFRGIGSPYIFLLPAAFLTNLSVQTGSALWYTEVLHCDFFFNCFWEKGNLEAAHVTKALRRNNLPFSCTLVKTPSLTSSSQLTSEQSGNTRQAEIRCELFSVVYATTKLPLFRIDAHKKSSMEIIFTIRKAKPLMICRV